LKRAEAFGAKYGLISHILSPLKGLKSMHMGRNIFFLLIRVCFTRKKKQKTNIQID